MQNGRVQQLNSAFRTIIVKRVAIFAWQKVAKVSTGLQAFSVCPLLAPCFPWCLDLPLSAGKMMKTNFQRPENNPFFWSQTEKAVKRRARTEATRTESCKRRLFSEEDDENDPPLPVIDPPVLRKRETQTQQLVRINNIIWHWLQFITSSFLYFSSYLIITNSMKMFVFVFIYSLAVLERMRNIKLQLNYQATDYLIWVCYNCLYKVVRTANPVKSPKHFLINIPRMPTLSPTSIPQGNQKWKFSITGTLLHCTKVTNAHRILLIYLFPAKVTTITAIIFIPSVIKKNLPVSTKHNSLM